LFGRRSAANSEPQFAVIFSAITFERPLSIAIVLNIINDTVQKLRLKEGEVHYRDITGADFPYAMGSYHYTQRIGLSGCGVPRTTILNGHCTG